MARYERTEAEKNARKLEYSAIEVHTKAVIQANMTQPEIDKILDTIKAVYDAEIRGQYYKGNTTSFASVIEKMYWQKYGDQRVETGESHLAPVTSKAVLSVQPTPTGNIITEQPRVKRQKNAPASQQAQEVASQALDISAILGAISAVGSKVDAISKRQDELENALTAPIIGKDAKLLNETKDL